jgi:hypothetical protein
MLVIKNVRREDFMGTHSIYIELIAVLMTAVPKDINEAAARDDSNDRDNRIGTTARLNVARKGAGRARVERAPSACG